MQNKKNKYIFKYIPLYIVRRLKLKLSVSKSFTLRLAPTFSVCVKEWRGLRGGGGGGCGGGGGGWLRGGWVKKQKVC